jgi:hypothetical protein
MKVEVGLFSKRKRTIGRGMMDEGVNMIKVPSKHVK